MANDIKIKVTVDNSTSAGYAEALAAGKTFGDQLESALREAGHASGHAAGDEIAGELNRQLRALRLPELDVHTRTADAKERLAELEAQVKALASDDMTIDVKIRTAKALAEIALLKKELRSVEDDAPQSGKGWGAKFMDSAKGALDGLGGEAGLGSVLGSVAIATAPLIGSTIAAAIVGGVGLGGIAGGFALAMRDESVQFAMLNLSDSLQEKLNGAVEAFAPAAVQSIDQVSAHLNKIDFKGMLSNLAPQLAPLTNGVTDFIDRLSSAIAKLVANSGPVITAIGQEIGDLGSVLQRGLGMLADNSKQEAEALHDLFAIINGGIEIVFMLVNALTEVYDIFHKMIEISPAGVYERLTNDQRRVKDSAVEMANAMLTSIKVTDQETVSAELAAKALKEQDDAIHQVANSLKASTDPMFAFMDAQDQLTEKQNAMNSAIRQHGKNSQQARSATKDYQKALIDYIGAAANATNGTGHLTAEQKRLLSSAGASKQRINELDNALYQAWKQANKLDGFQVDITVRQNFIQTGKYISPEQIASPQNLYSGLAHGGVKGAFSGPISSGLTMVGERGPELLNLPAGTSVTTAGDTARMFSGASGGWRGGHSGGQPLQVNLVLDGAVLATAMVDPQRHLVRTQFGGSVQAAYGQG